MRNYKLVANEKWIVWLNDLSPEVREVVMRNELYYFDELVAMHMTLSEILDDALGVLDPAYV